MPAINVKIKPEKPSNATARDPSASPLASSRSGWLADTS